MNSGFLREKPSGLAFPSHSMSPRVRFASGSGTPVSSPDPLPECTSGKPDAGAIVPVETVPIETVSTEKTPVDKTASKPAEVPAVPAAAKKKEAKRDPMSLLKRMGNGVLWLAPITNLIGGASLLTSAVLPVRTPPVQTATVQNPAAPATVTDAQGKVIAVEATPEDIKAVDSTLSQIKKTLNDMGYKVFTQENKHLLHELGWKFTSIGILMTSINRLAAGYVSKQPGMVLCSLGMMATAPTLLFAPSIAAQAGLAFFLGPWLAGAANKVRNKFGLKPGEAPREMDMAPLVDRDALKKAMGEANPNRLKVMKAWLGYFLKTCKFIGTDQVLLVTNTAKSFASIWKERSEWRKHAKEDIKEAYDYLVGRREETPDLLKPSATQNQLASMMMYAGSVPILILAGQQGAVLDTCMSMIAAGSFTANIPLLATGIHNKDAEMIVAIPIMTAGITHLNTDAGQGLTRLGVAGYMNHLRKDIIKHPETHKPDNPNEEIPV